MREKMKTTHGDYTYLGEEINEINTCETLFTRAFTNLYSPLIFRTLLLIIKLPLLTKKGMLIKKYLNEIKSEFIASSKIATSSSGGSLTFENH